MRPATAASATAASATPKLRLPELADIQRELAERRLRHFIKYMWPVVEPTNDFVPNWHIDAICDHLEAVKLGIKNEGAVGAIRKLIINIPPRMMKSLSVSVGFPAWLWIDAPSFRSLFASYGQDLSIRDSVKTRNVILSPWYQRNWGDRFQLSGDQNAKTRFENNKTGFRLATSVGGLATGEGADGLFVDDPHNLSDTLSLSEKSLQTVADWFDMVLQTRLNNQKTGFIVLIMQRAHHKDLTGHIIAKELGYTHLCLPMEYEANHPHLWAADPRAIEGELLCPARIGTAEAVGLKKAMGSYASAGQLQQRPAPREGGIIKRAWFQFVAAAPANLERVVRWWDMAATEKKAGNNPDFTAGAKVGMDAEGNAYVMHVVAEQVSSFEAETLIKNTAGMDGMDTDIWMEQEPGSAGKALINIYSRKLSGQMGHKFRGEPSTGSKDTYVDVLAAAMESGTVFFVRGTGSVPPAWIEALMDSACSFPNADHDDDIESVAKAYCKLATRIKARSRDPFAEAAPVAINQVLLRALEYVRNTGGAALLAQFNEDNEPIGDRLWAELSAAGLVALNADGCIALTAAGRQTLDAATQDSGSGERQTGLAGAQMDEDMDFEAIAEANARKIYGNAVVDNWAEHAARGDE